MDPDATYNDMHSAWDVKDMETARERMADLNDWLSRGGFLPDAAKFCRWFALCTDPTEVFVWHPVIPPVPTCKRCAAKAERLKG